MVWNSIKFTLILKLLYLISFNQKITEPNPRKNQKKLLINYIKIWLNNKKLKKSIKYHLIHTLYINNEINFLDL